MDTKALHQKMLDLATHGKLVPQDPNNEPVLILLERIRAEEEWLIEEGEIRQGKESVKTSDTPHYKSVLLKILNSWVWAMIGEICSKIGSGGTPRGSNYSANGVPFFRSQNIYSDRLVYDNIKRISEEVHQKMKGTEVLANDLLLNITGGSLGRCTVVPADSNYGNANQHVCIMRSVLVEPEYFHALILPSYSVKSMKITGSGREGLPKYSLEQMAFPLPPLSEQQRIVVEIEELFALIGQMEHSKVNLQTIIKQTKGKILGLAIHGKLVLQDPNDKPATELLERMNPDFTPCDNEHYTQLPDGWIFCRLDQIIGYEQSVAYIVESTTYDDSYSTPVLTAGKSSIIGYTSRATGIYSNLPYIIPDDFTTDSKLVDFPFKVKSSVMKILKVHKDIEVDYVAMFMSTTKLVGGTHKRYWISEYSELKIPIPSKAEQKQITHIIRGIFTQLDLIMESL